MDRWTKDEVDYLVSFYDKKDYKTLSDILNRTEGAIRAKCCELGLVKHGRWTSDEYEFIRTHKDMPVKEIAKALNRSESAVHLKFSRNGIKKSPYNCNYSYFKTIDSEDKAYWLGFIYSDGWISITSEANSGVVGIQLQRRDDEHLKKFNKSINGNYKISYGKKKCSISNSEEEFPYCLIKIYSIDMVNDLISHGVNNHKSYEIKMPSIDECLIRYFIRGFFDGDGCVRIRTDKKTGRRYPSCDITCHERNMLDEIRSILYSNGITSYIYPDKTKYRLYISGCNSNYKFLEYIYGDAKIYLDRKYEIYKNITELNDHNCLAS